MAKVSWKGWREEPEEDSRVAYEFLTEKRTKQFYIVFGRTDTLNNQLYEESDDQTQPVDIEADIIGGICTYKLNSTPNYTPTYKNIQVE